MLLILFFVIYVILMLSGKYSKAGVHFYVFIIFYGICHFLYFLSKEYILHEVLNDSEIIALTQSLVLFFIISITYIVISKFGSKKKFYSDVIIFKDGATIFYIFISLFFIGVILYFIKNGISLSSDYNARIEQNAGGGIAIILMYSYVPSLLIFYSRFNSKLGLYLSLILALVFGLIYYFLIGGSRNLLASGVFAIAYMAIVKKHLSTIKVCVIGAVGFVFLLSMEIFRYSNDIADVVNFLSSDALGNLSFIFESFSPMFAVERINNALDGKIFSPQGLSTFFNEFGILIPRFMWSDKPLNVFNNGYFYTSEILKINTNLTMSPTLLGSFIIMFGSGFYWVLGIFTGIILFWFDNILRTSQSNFNKVIILSSVGYLFFWVRDGFEVYCYVILKFAMAIILARFIYSLYKLIVPMKRK